MTEVNGPNSGETLVNSTDWPCPKLMSSTSNLAPSYQQTAACVTRRATRIQVKPSRVKDRSAHQQKPTNSYMTV